jgi:oligopeptide transport system substrate-binding protein
VGLGRDPVSIDPRTVADDEGELIVRALFEGLVDVSPEGVIVAASAASWSVSPDGLTYRFQLRPTRFHDGRPVTAADFERALLAVFDPAIPPFFRDDLLDGLRGARVAAPVGAAEAADGAAGTGRAGGVLSTVSTVRGTAQDVLEAGGIEVDDGELVLRLDRPASGLLHDLTDVALMPVPARALTDPQGFAQEPIGNGPFRMAGPREIGGFIRLAAVDDHHRRPGIDGLLFQMYPTDGDRSQRWADLLANRLQITGVPSDRRREAVLLFGRPETSSHGTGLFDHGTPTLYAYGFNVASTPFDDVRLRQALSAAIDREVIARSVLADSVDPAATLLPSGLVAEPPVCPHCVYDVDLARALYADWLADSGTPEGVIPSVVLSYPRGPGHVTIAERVAEDLEGTLGVRVRLRARSAADLLDDIASGSADVFRIGLRAGRMGEAAAGSVLDPAFRPGAFGSLTGWSGVGGRAGPFQESLDALARTPDPMLAGQLEQAILSEALIIPLFRSRHDLVVHPDVAGFRLDPSGRWWPELVSLR